ncbi:class I lanthipeptide [Pontimicrobium sp. MEBiC06410]|jgi:hypothetical protein
MKDLENKTLCLKKQTIIELNTTQLFKIVGGSTDTGFIGSERTTSSFLCNSNQSFNMTQ